MIIGPDSSTKCNTIKEKKHRQKYELAGTCFSQTWMELNPKLCHFFCQKEYNEKEASRVFCTALHKKRLVTEK